MYVRRTVRWGLIWRFAWRNLLVFTVWSTLVTVLYQVLRARGVDVRLPFSPLSMIGVAVAFYVAFKNNQAYDRFWEARKIWGGIVNLSRTWGNSVLGYLTPAQAPGAGDALREVQRRLIYRQLAWVNSLRVQLRKTTIYDRREQLAYMPRLDLGGDNSEEDVWRFLSAQEREALTGARNRATQIGRLQGEDLRTLCQEAGLLTELRHTELMELLREMYDLQGRCERIKNTPLPRQYASFSATFVWVFVALLPFGLLGEFVSRSGPWAAWLTIPCAVLISWVFATMEVIGDASEDPFDNYINDVPMSALCRTIEIDLRQMLGETDLPPPLAPVNDVLM